MKLKKSILFWSVIVLLAGFVTFLILEANGLAPREWLSETFCVLIVLGFAAGIFQLLLYIPFKRLKIALIVICTAAAAVGGYYGVLLLRFMHRPEHRGEYEGTPCIIETQRALWGNTHSDWYYEYHGLFIRGAECLHIEHIEYPD